MRKFIFVFLVLFLAACSSQNFYQNFDYSYSRSGGISPIYENLLIRGHQAHYSFEGQGKSYKKNFRLKTADLQAIEESAAKNQFRFIQEDYQKLYDNISTIINIKKGEQSAIKSDASRIMTKDQQRWDNVEAVFRGIIEQNISPSERK